MSLGRDVSGFWRFRRRRAGRGLTLVIQRLSTRIEKVDADAAYTEVIAVYKEIGIIDASCIDDDAVAASKVADVVSAWTGEDFSMLA